MSFFRYLLGALLGVVFVALLLVIGIWYVPRYYLRRLFMSAEARRLEDKECNDYGRYMEWW